MRLEHRAEIAAPPDRVWDLLMDVPRMARCLPGVEGVAAFGDDRYRGTLRVQVGPIRLALAGEVRITGRDAEARRATMRVDAKDAAAMGAVAADLVLELAPTEAGSTLVVRTDAQVLGRLGELGQPIIKRKADELMRAFAQNLAGEAGS